MSEEPAAAESAMRTRASLLVQLAHEPNDESAWARFDGRYGPKIRDWCRQWGLQPADAEDVTQAVLVRLATKMRGFRYDPGQSFRAWLKTLTRHAWSDFATARRRLAPAAVVAGEAGEEVLLTVAAGDDLERRMADAFDLELLELATRQVRAAMAAHTWEAFRLTALEGWAAADAAAELAMPVASVFKAKSNVQRRLREAVAQLEAGG